MSLVIWREDDQAKAYDFKIVHKSTDGRRCDPGDGAGYKAHLELSTFVGPDGQAQLLSLLSAGPVIGPVPELMPRVGNLDQYVDLFRRLQTPWYEEARTYFSDDTVQSSMAGLDVHPYTPKVLERIAKEDV